MALMDAESNLRAKGTRKIQYCREHWPPKDTESSTGRKKAATGGKLLVSCNMKLAIGRTCGTQEGGLPQEFLWTLVREEKAIVNLL